MDVSITSNSVISHIIDSSSNNAAARYVGYPQMNSIFKHLTQVSGITCRFGDRVRPVLVSEAEGKSIIFSSELTFLLK